MKCIHTIVPLRSQILRLTHSVPPSPYLGYTLVCWSDVFSPFKTLNLRFFFEKKNLDFPPGSPHFKQHPTEWAPSNLCCSRRAPLFSPCPIAQDSSGLSQASSNHGWDGISHRHGNHSITNSPWEQLEVFIVTYL